MTSGTLSLPRVEFSRVSPTSASPSVTRGLQRLALHRQRATRCRGFVRDCRLAAAAADLRRCTRTPSSCRWRCCVCCSSTCTTCSARPGLARRADRTLCVKLSHQISTFNGSTSSHSNAVININGPTGLQHTFTLNGSTGSHSDAMLILNGLTGSDHGLVRLAHVAML